MQQTKASATKSLHFMRDVLLLLVDCSDRTSPTAKEQQAETGGQAVVAGEMPGLP